MLPYFTELLALALGGLLVCYGLGAALLRVADWQTEEPFFAVYVRLLTGIITITAAYALLRTGGVSVLLPAPVLLAGVMWSARRPAQGVIPLATHMPLGPALWLTSLLALAVFVGQYGLVYEPGAAYLQTPFQDEVYYSRLTLMLNHAGLETNSLEVVFPQFQTEQPYHYLEVWLNALLVWATGLPSVWVFFVSMATILITTVGVGFAAIYAHYGLRPGLAALLGLLSLTITGTVWPFLTQFLFVANGSLLSHMHLTLHPKLAPVYLSVLLAVLLLLRQRWMGVAAALALLPLLTVATAPAAAAGQVGLAFYLGLSRRLPWSRALALLGPLAAVSLYVGLFYALQPAAYQFASAGHTSALAAVLPASKELKTLLNIAIGSVLNYGIYYLGYALLVGLLWWQGPAKFRSAICPNWPLLAWSVSTLLGAVLMRTLGHHFLDGVQFFSNIMVPVSSAVLAAALSYTLREASVSRLAVAVLGLLSGALINAVTDGPTNTRFSATFLAEVGPVLRSLPARGGYLLGDEDYQNAYMTSSDSYTAGTYVSNFKNDYTLVSLSSLVPDSLNTDPRYARDSAQAALIKGRSTLFRLAKLRQMTGQPLSADSAALALVHRAGLQFICASRRARLPATLRPLVRRQYRDARSGEVLYVLHPLKPTAPLQVQ
ncbi:hypothetical protein N008_03985 [Hymenobacter sp. APR13]|nr:hypothetical protein N008_03985 [Hymenobacter sp. APR13]